jgi:hypothetical protein
MVFLPRTSLVPILIFGLAACAEPAPGPELQPQYALPASEGYAARKAAYLDHCNAQNGPGKGGIHGQVCRVAKGETTYNEEVIREKLRKINHREDTSDFDLNSLLRMLYLDRERHVIPALLKQDIETTVLGFKYWYDEPGPDEMVWWSENHQVLFHAAELMAGQLFPDAVFTNSGMTGRQKIARATPDLLRWMDYRARFGFSEFHSNVYYNEDMPPLINLVDFAENEELRAKAAILLDTLFFDMASHYFAGRFATAHGRTYPRNLLGGLTDSMTEPAFIGLNNVPVTSVTELGGGNFTAAHMATSEHYAVPEILEQIANHPASEIEVRGRDGIDVLDGPQYGITYTAWNDIMFWWGMTGYIDPEIITGTFNMVDTFTMWDGYEFKNYKFVQPLVGTSILRTAAEAALPMSRGVVLETANVYTYRTPHYQLSGVQDFKPGSWTAQVHVWKATLDSKAYVFTTYPGGVDGDYMAGDWTGGWVPRATMHKSVGIFQYRLPVMPKLDGILERVATADLGFGFVDYTHAYFPKNEFDEVVREAGWTLARKGDAYVGLWSQAPTTWSTGNDYELIAAGRENVWVIEMGDKASNGTFAEFAAALTAASVTVGNQVVYESPYRGTYKAGWTGDFTVDGKVVDLGPYKRFDTPFAQQEFNTKQLEIRYEGRTLQLDFARAERRLTE